MNTLLQDLRYALRSLRRTPAFTITVVLTLALGIGANTAIFSVIDAVLLRPLSYREPERLVQIWETRPDAQAQFGVTRIPTSNPNYRDWKEQAQSFEAMGAFRYSNYTLSGTERPEALWGARLSPGLLPMLGIEPAIGRGFAEGDGEPGSAGVVLLGNDLWRRQFGGDPSALGRTITLNGLPRTIIGVMPPGFRFPPPASYPILSKVRTDLWVPVERDTVSRGSRSFGVIGRLRPGVTIQSAAAEMDGISARLGQTYTADRGWTTLLVPFQEQVTGAVRRPLSILLAAVGFVLLIACANVANLLLARAMTRRREIAVRAALGAGRARIARQLLTESVVLAVLGGAAGVLIAVWGIALLRGLLPTDFPRLDEIGLDARALGFTAMLALATGLGFGLAPALAASRTSLGASLGDGSRGNTAGPASRRRRGILVTLQVSLALVLLVGAGLLIRSFQRLLDVDPGFRPDDVLAAGVALPESQYPDAPAQTAFFNRLLERLRAAPGVAKASLVNVLPFADQDEFDGFFIQGRPFDRNQDPVSARWLVTDPDYFSTMGIRVIRGRAFDASDDTNAPGAAMINRTMARQFWPDEDPIGQQVTLGDPVTGPWRTVVGIVDDVRHSGFAADPKPELYTPYAQTPWSAMNVVLHAPSLDVAAATADLREALRATDPGIGAGTVSSMPSLIAESVAPERLNMVLLGLLAGLALVLAALGVYGVVNYSVATRTSEMGLRLALGAAPGDVLRLVIGEGARLAVAGSVIGLVGAWATTRLLQSILFDVSPTDPVTFIAVPCLLALVTVIASWLPARRAARVEPITALRNE